MQSKRLLLALIAWLALGSFQLKADEWVDTDNDGQGDILQMAPFVVNGNDPETFDWEGYFAYLESTGYFAFGMEPDASDFASVNAGGSVPTGATAATQVKNAGGGVALVPSPNPAATGYVRSNGNGSYSIVINETILDAQIRNDATVLAIIRASITVHETNHVTVALSRNSGIFDGSTSGWILASATNLIKNDEVNAYTAERTWLQGVINAGTYNSTTLTPAEITILEAYKADVNDGIRNNGGTP